MCNNRFTFTIDASKKTSLKNSLVELDAEFHEIESLFHKAVYHIANIKYIFIHLSLFFIQSKPHKIIENSLRVIVK